MTAIATKAIARYAKHNDLSTPTPLTDLTSPALWRVFIIERLTIKTGSTTPSQRNTDRSAIEHVAKIAASNVPRFCIGAKIQSDIFKMALQICAYETTERHKGHCTNTALLR
jgi:hypothetical protein